jgi:hypothetical protein
MRTGRNEMNEAKRIELFEKLDRIEWHKEPFDAFGAFDSACFDAQECGFKHGTDAYASHVIGAIVNTTDYQENEAVRAYFANFGIIG